MKIGIMGAMPEKIDSIHALMSDVETIERGGRIYHIGKISGKEVVLVFSRWGKVASATTATSLITEFKIDHLIFTGVAGASNPDLNIGDIVISKCLYQHDMDARPLMPRHEIPLTGITFFKADSILIGKASAAADKLLATLSEKIPVSMLEKFSIRSPKFILGTIATGDQFISDREHTAAIMAEKPETDAVEMEGAAVAQVCSDYGISFVVVRTISDQAGHTSELDFPLFIKEIARLYSEHMVKNMLDEEESITESGACEAAAALGV
ncbi:MAG: 5'-methylthioadenosine/S-adenosylhomocysteine nucleosidase [Gammaproteobacteria bacterium RIFCSPHIGHO2_12_FULL_35_23]|nr:MAG: 5'-methylthioadenosine/S-adenosylhomocysteine nucleosidase [Gammaproteobacteria bacterium RIFCSPHIGHO2_12_FULL_35_23]